MTVSKCPKWRTMSHIHNCCRNFTLSLWIVWELHSINLALLFREETAAYMWHVTTQRICWFPVACVIMPQPTTNHTSMKLLYICDCCSWPSSSDNYVHPWQRYEQYFYSLAFQKLLNLIVEKEISGHKTVKNNQLYPIFSRSVASKAVSPYQFVPMCKKAGQCFNYSNNQRSTDFNYLWKKQCFSLIKQGL